MADDQTDVTARLAALEAQVEGLTKRLYTISQAVVQRLDDEPKPAPVRWGTLTENETGTTLDALRGWVTWLRDRYALDPKSLPWCWDRHGALLEELSALWTAWAAAFGPDGNPGAPAVWHDTLARVLARLREWGARTGCRPGEHHEDILAAAPTAYDGRPT